MLCKAVLSLASTSCSAQLASAASPSAADKPLLLGHTHNYWHEITQSDLKHINASFHVRTSDKGLLTQLYVPDPRARDMVNERMTVFASIDKNGKPSFVRFWCGLRERYQIVAN